MAALHSLQDHVVAGLQGQMQIGRHARLAHNQLEKDRIDFRRINGGKTKTRKLRHQLQNTPNEIAQRRLPGQVPAPARQIDTRQHDLAVALPHQIADMADHFPRRHRSRIPATVRNDAEGAAMVAAILNLQKGPCSRLRFLRRVLATEELRRTIPHGHYVIDTNALARLTKMLWRKRTRQHLVVVAQHLIDFRHGGEGLRVNLRRAACHNHRRTGPLAPRLSNPTTTFRHRLIRHRAGVDDHRICQPIIARKRRHSVAFRRVQAAAQGYDINIFGHSPAMWSVATCESSFAIRA